MPRLSILIPSLTFDGSVEQTLISVLQNRPEYSEVLVVTAQPYHDPYELGREVRFLTDSSADRRVDLINHGCQAARGDVVHLLLPGVLAVDGWTDRIWSHFTDRQVACVAPVLLSAAAPARVAGLGVAFSRSGCRQVVGREQSVPQALVRTAEVLAPTLSAGFYRHEVLRAVQGWDRDGEESLADVEFGLLLRDLGLMTRVEPQSTVVTPPLLTGFPRTSAEASQAERIFRRQPRSSSANLSHACQVGWEFLSGLPHPRALSRLFGRWTARRDTTQQARYEERLQQARLAWQTSGEEPATIRGDFALARRRLDPLATPRRQKTAA